MLYAYYDNTTILVTTGVDNVQTISQKGIRPDLVVQGLEELVKLWQKAYD